MNDVVLEINQVSKVYHLYDRPLDRLLESLLPGGRLRHRDRYALNNISFTVRQGEIMGIIGVNGSGKSTILKIITGVLSQTSGDVRVQGRVSALLELGTGFNPDYTGRENVYVSGMMMGYSRDEVTERLDDIRDFADIGAYFDQPVKTYSSGMFARLAFAVAINVDPDILIIDEALSVGDYFFQAKCFRKFEDFRRRNKTILFVSHDMGSILKYCDRVVLLHHGELLYMGVATEAVNRYKQCLSGRKADDTKSESVSHKIDEPIETVTGILKEKMHINPHAVIYGDGGAEIIDYGIVNEKGETGSFVHKNESFTLVMLIRFHQAIQQPILAFTIKDLKGMELYGTNTQIEGIDTGLAMPNAVWRIQFSQKMYLNRGNYLLSLGCTSYHGNTLTVHQRLYDICSIDVIATRTTVGFVDFNSQVTLNKLLEGHQQP